MFTWLETFGYLNIGVLRQTAPCAPHASRSQHAAMTQPTDTPGCGQEMTPLNQRVIVVGAGLAGLGAARHLLHLGFDVMVLEARHRSGGRVLTDTEHFDGVAVDLGAGVIPGIDCSPLTVICRQIGLETTPLDCVQPVTPLLRKSGVTAQKSVQVEAQFHSILQEARSTPVGPRCTVLNSWVLL